MEHPRLKHTLSEQQEHVKNEILKAVEKKDRWIYRMDRNDGKSTILDHAGYELQWLGYTVILISYPLPDDRVADILCTTLEAFRQQWQGIYTPVVLVDDSTLRLTDLEEVKMMCAERDIPCVGLMRR